MNYDVYYASENTKNVVGRIYSTDNGYDFYHIVNGNKKFGDSFDTIESFSVFAKNRFSPKEIRLLAMQ